MISQNLKNSFNSWMDKKRHSIDIAFNYATTKNLKNVRGVVTSKFARKTYLASVKFNVDKFDIDK